MSQDKKAAIKEKLTTVREETVLVLGGLTEAQWDARVYRDVGAEWSDSAAGGHGAASERGWTALM